MLFAILNILNEIKHGEDLVTRPLSHETQGAHVTMLKLCKTSLHACSDTKQLDSENDMNPNTACTAHLHCNWGTKKEDGKKNTKANHGSHG